MQVGQVDKIQQRIVSGLLSHLDRLPRHIGIVMDGNRRFASRQGTDRKFGHSKGFYTMGRILSTAYSSGIKEITVYAFSIENFNRSPEEVSDLMEIARTHLRELVEHDGVANQYGVRINVLGRVSMLPPDIQELVRSIMSSSCHNTKATLNLCMPYTARDDIVTGITKAVQSRFQSLDKAIEMEDISSNMYTCNSQPLDLLVRTSNTHRLSDFLLWETTSATHIDFVSDLWPDYTPWHFLQSILRWRISR